MQAASAAYKQAMRESLRNHSFMRVTIGVINQTAQASAHVADPEAFTYFSALTKPFDNYEVTELYASCDQDWTAVDGSMYFLPREKADVVLNAGLVTEELLGAISGSAFYQGAYGGVWESLSGGIFDCVGSENDGGYGKRGRAFCDGGNL